MAMTEYTDAVWDLYCEGEFVYSTDDPEDAESWVAADPEGHQAVVDDADN